MRYDNTIATPHFAHRRPDRCGQATISFLFTTPGIDEPAGGGFPAISLVAEFLLKDIPLLGLSFWTLADSLRAAGWRQGATGQ